jgi:hypothetical protein
MLKKKAQQIKMSFRRKKTRRKLVGRKLLFSGAADKLLYFT